MLLCEVKNNPGLMRKLERVRSYNVLYDADRYDGVPLCGMLECNLFVRHGPPHKYWFSCVEIQDDRRIAPKNTTHVYAIILLSEEDIEAEQTKHRAWEKASNLFHADPAKNESILKEFYNKYPPRGAILHEDSEVVAWCTDPPDSETVLMLTNCKCAAVELGVHPMHCKRCDGRWKYCDKMTDRDYLNRLDKHELIEIVEELSSR